MHQTKITRDMVYRAVMLRERYCAMPVGPPIGLAESDPDRFLALSDDYDDRLQEAQLPLLRELGELLNILADEMGIDIQKIRQR